MEEEKEEEGKQEESEKEREKAAEGFRQHSKGRRLPKVARASESSEYQAQV